MSENQFETLGLDQDLLLAVLKKGFDTPSEIQALTIPFVLSTDRDFIAQAQTGTGKTAAFGLPVMQLLEPMRSVPQAIILAPTRELALQVTQEMETFNEKGLAITAIYGGAPIGEQLQRLRRGVDIVVGTPGRVLDHIRRGTLDLSEVKFMVLDEADEMLNMGFIEDIETIMAQMPDTKRVLLFSATMPARIEALANRYMRDPEVLKVEAKFVTNDLVTQTYYDVREGDKFEALTRVIDIAEDFYGIVFCKTKVGVDDTVKRLIERGYNADALHGDVSQAQREKILSKFKQRSINILVATDVAARGIDVNNLTHVVNHSLPQDNESYVHRIGRTGRAGNKGMAVTFVSPSESRQFGFLKRNLRIEIPQGELPTPADIVAVKREKILSEMQVVIQAQSYEGSMSMAAELLEEHDPQVAVAAVLRMAFKNELSESSYAVLKAAPASKKGSGKSKIIIALGSNDGYTARKIVKMLKSVCGIGDQEIDDLRVMDTYCYATVPAGEASGIVDKLNVGGDNIAQVSSEKVVERRGGGGDRRGGGRRNFRGGGRDGRRGGGGERGGRGENGEGGGYSGKHKQRGGGSRGNSGRGGGGSHRGHR